MFCTSKRFVSQALFAMSLKKARKFGIAGEALLNHVIIVHLICYVLASLVSVSNMIPHFFEKGYS